MNIRNEKYSDYPIRVIDAYVNAYDIDGFNIDELENDPLFMIDVINYSGDYRLYDICLDSVKKDYRFVKFLITKFKHKEDFIIKVADYYLDNADYNNQLINIFELNIILSDMNKRNELKFLKYMANATIEYKKFFDRNDLLVKLGVFSEDVDIFRRVRDYYGDNKVIKNYFARNMVNEKLFSYDRNLYDNFEEFIHSKIKNKKALQYDIDEYIIKNLVGNDDKELRFHLNYNHESLEDINKLLLRILNNWDNYIRNLNEKRIELVDYYVNKKIDEITEFNGLICDSFRYSSYEIIQFVLENIKLGEILKNTKYYKFYDSLFFD